MTETPRRWPRLTDPPPSVKKVRHTDGARQVWTRMGEAGYHWAAPGWEDGVSWAQVLRWGEVEEVIEQPERTPCPEGFHWIGQTFAHCDNCGLPAWEHAGYAELAGPAKSPFDTARWALRPWKPGEAEACKAKWGAQA